jgi:hypothetical protein
MAVQLTDLTDLATVETFLGLSSGNVADPLLQIFISSTSIRVGEFLSRNFPYVILPDWAQGSYTNGQLILPVANNPGGFTFRCSVAGVTNASAPSSWPQTVTNTIADGTVTWLNVGAGVNVSEQRNGKGQREMMLRQYPVNTLGSVEMYGVPQVAATADNIDGWVLDTIGLQRRGTVALRGIAAWTAWGTGGGLYQFRSGTLSIRFNYGFGYWTPGQALSNGGTPTDPLPPPAGVQALPFDLKEAVTEMVSLRFKQKARWGDTGMGMGPERVNYFLKEMHESTQAALLAYKDQVPLWN